MKHRYGIILIVLTLLVATAGAQGVVNGGMDGDVGADQVGAPWTAWSADTWLPGGFAGDGGVYASGMPASPQGGTFASVAAIGTTYREWIRQTVTGLTPGEVYTLTFFAANAGFEFVTGPWPTEDRAGSLEVSLGAESHQTPMMVHDGFGSQVWYPFVMTFTPSAASLTLEFRATDESLVGGGNVAARLAVDGVVLEAQSVASEELTWGAVKELYR